jgi:hypothetical protein
MQKIRQKTKFCTKFGFFGDEIGHSGKGFH